MPVQAGQAQYAHTGNVGTRTDRARNTHNHFREKTSLDARWAGTISTTLAECVHRLTIRALLTTSPWKTTTGGGRKLALTEVNSIHGVAPNNRKSCAGLRLAYPCV